MLDNMFSWSSANQINQSQLDWAKEQQQWQTSMANTKYQRAMADMKAAGLNPMIMADSGMGAMPSGSSPSSVSPSFGHQSRLFSALQGISALQLQQDQSALLEAQTNKVNAEAENISSTPVGPSAYAGITANIAQALAGLGGLGLGIYASSKGNYKHSTSGTGLIGPSSNPFKATPEEKYYAPRPVFNQKTQQWVYPPPPHENPRNYIYPEMSDDLKSHLLQSEQVSSAQGIKSSSLGKSLLRMPFKVAKLSPLAQALSILLYTNEAQ